MREHALPQDVTSYKFHIIGNMTLRQFGEVAGGCAIGFLIYLTNLPAIIKWPIILLFAGAGAIAAFLPIAERPLDQWVIAFFKALYRPTLFFWKRTSKIPDPFLHQTNQENTSLVADIDLTPVRRQRVKEFMHSVQTTVEKDNLEKYTDQRLQEVMSIFGPDAGGSLAVAPNAAAPAYSYAAPAVPPAAVTASAPEPPPEALEEQPTSPISDQFSQPVATDFSPIQQAAGGVTEPNSLRPDTHAVTIPKLAPAGNAPATENAQAPVLSLDANMPAPVTVFAADDSTYSSKQPENWQPIEAAASQFGSTPSTLPSRNVPVPQNQTVNVEPTAAQITSDVDQNSSLDQFANESSYSNFQAAPALQGQTTVAQTNANLPFPSAPSEPNKVVGMVLDQRNNPMPNVIVEIRTPEGLPARAVKTNAIGQFFITTPLANGNYIVVAEKDGQQFTPLSLQLNGAIISPIEIKAS